MSIIDRRYSVAEGQAVKAPCRAATTANITLSGQQTLDGVAVVEGDRVLVKDQSTASQNGIYTVSTGPWTRTRDFDGASDVVSGTRVYVTSGTAAGAVEFVVTTTGDITIDSTSISFTSIGAATIAAAAAATAAAAAASASETAAETAETNAEAAEAAAVAAAASVAVASVADRTALKALNTTTSKSALLRESGREGTFVWKTGDYSTLITADAQEGIYVKANAIASSSGAWVRVRVGSEINVAWFGSASYTVAAAALTMAGQSPGSTVIFPENTTYDLSSSSLTVPDYTSVICPPSTTLRRSAELSGATPYSAYTSAMVIMGDYSKWTGGVLDNTAVLTTSTSSNTMGTGGTKTFTVAAGLGLTTSTFLRIYSRANPANKFEGTVNSYAGTTLVLNATFGSGSGTYTDWNINYGAVFHCPIVLHDSVRTTLEGVKITGNWYTGFLLDGNNPTVPGTVLVSKCVLKNCYAEGIQNRNYSIYGNVRDCVFDGCYANGSSGISDYGFNFNAANTGATDNFIMRNKVIGCTADGCGFQGFAWGDKAYYNIADGCTANDISNAAGVGFEFIFANSSAPQWNIVRDCVAIQCVGQGFLVSGTLYGGVHDCSAISCGVGFLINASGGNQSQYVSLNDCEAIGSTTMGFNVQGNSNRCDLVGIKAVANTTNGVQIDSGAVGTLVTGRSRDNTSNNLVDNGTSSITTNLTVL